VDDTLPEEGSFADKFMRKLLNSTDVIDLQKEFIDHLDFNHRYHYKGSLTTPPYTEGLFWTVLANPVPVRHETLALFESHSQGEIAVGSSNRDVQPLNMRRVFKVDIDVPVE
jgi:carbonic anhydrase